MSKPENISYEDMVLQPWDAIKSFMPKIAYYGLLVGSATFYLNRFFVENKEGKGGLQDAKKARNFLDKLILEMEKDQK